MRKAQNTTTKSTKITIDKQFTMAHYYGFIHRRVETLNNPNDGFVNVIEYFIGNLDKSCLMYANGKIYVVASSGNNKTEKISDDCREYITTSQMGFAYDQHGA